MVFSIFVPSGEGLYIVHGPQQVSEKIVLIGHATETTHQLQTNSQARKAKLEITHQNDNQKAQKQLYRLHHLEHLG